VPICSIDCKIAHFNELNNINKILAKDMNDDERIASTYVNDSLNVLEYLCKVSSKEVQVNTDTQLLKLKALTLELIMMILDKPSPAIIAKQRFREIIRE